MALTLMASSRGLGLAHVVSAGNQAVVDAVDVMSFYLAEPGVRVIAAVIEGLADVAKFRRVAAQAAERNVPDRGAEARGGRRRPAARRWPTPAPSPDRISSTTPSSSSTA